MIWSEKYKPKSMEEIPQQIEAFVEAVKKKKCVFLIGPSGTGKTSLVYAYAKENDLEILEVNASDFRDKASIESIVGSSSKQASLFQREKIILVDELDGISGQEDRGGLSALVKVVEETRVPIILVANDAFDLRFNDLRKRCAVIEFERVPIKTMAKILEGICKAENITYDQNRLFSLAAKSNGDVRAAINDLQTYSSEKNLDPAVLESRDNEESIFNALKIIMKTNDAMLASQALDNVDVDLDECLLFLEENIAHEYKNPEDLKNAYNSLSKADVFRGRIRRQQYWRLLVYQSNFMTAGVSCAKQQVYPGITNYKRSIKPLRIWQGNMRNQKPKAISEKLAKVIHYSEKKTFKSFLIYKPFLNNQAIAEELELSDDEFAFLKK